MINMNWLAGAFLLVPMCVSPASAQNQTKPLRVLLIGNSQCPTILNEHLIENLAASAQGGRPIEIVGCVKGGASLQSHWNAESHGDAEAQKLTARALISSGKWDFVILQEHYRAEEAASAPYARQFHQAIKEAGAQTVFFSTASIIQDYPKEFDRLHRMNFAMGRELGVPVVDASQAYCRYLGKKPSAALIESLFAKDRAHPGLRGSYLYSCGIYSVLTGRSPVGLAAPKSIPANVAKSLQETAWAQYHDTAAALKK